MGHDRVDRTRCGARYDAGPSHAAGPDRGYDTGSNILWYASTLRHILVRFISTANQQNCGRILGHEIFLMTLSLEVSAHTTEAVLYTYEFISQNVFIN